MFERIHNQIGTAGLIVAVVALVVAVGGSAVAATGGNLLAGASGQRHQKKTKGVTLAQVRKIAKQEASKYANSHPGPAGPQGPAGGNGKDGSNGAGGANGESVKVSAYEGPACVTEEGAEFTNATGTAFACNGEEGSPWAASGTLPIGSTETGSWSIFLNGEPAEAKGLAFINFAIPLSAELGPTNVIFVTGAAPANCENASHAGTASASNPEAKSGFLCVYRAVGTVQGSIVKAGSSSPTGGASVSGAVISQFEGEPEEFAYGTWAVTG